MRSNKCMSLTGQLLREAFNVEIIAIGEVEGAAQQEGVQPDKRRCIAIAIPWESDSKL